MSKFRSDLTGRFSYQGIAADRDWYPSELNEEWVEFEAKHGLARAYRHEDQTFVVVLADNGVLEWKIGVPDGVPDHILAAAMAEAERWVENAM